MTFNCLRFRDSRNWRARFPYVYPPGTVSRLYPRARGSLFVASYDSQGYGGSIRPRLHTNFSWFSLCSLGTDCMENATSSISSCVVIRYCGNVFPVPLPNNRCLFWVCYSAFHPSCHTILPHVVLTLLVEKLLLMKYKQTCSREEDLLPWAA
jgi:hypothetical protein